MALSAPAGLTATAISTIRIDLSWENQGSYDFIHIERRVKDTPPYVQIDMIDGHAEYYADESPPLTPEVTYEYKIRGRKLYPVEEYTAYTGVEEATTFAVLAAPSLCIATAFSNFIEVTFKDNSLEENKFQIARKKDGDAWVEEVAWTAPNVDYYRDEAVVAGSVYQYKVLAWRGGGDVSAFSNVDSATAFSIPGNPANLVISDIQDTSMRLAWTGVANETGYKILISDDGTFTGEEIIRIIGADIVTFLVTGLDPSTQYWFRVYAYNGVGDSAGFIADNDTTLAAGVYVPTEFEKWIRNPNIEPVYLAEIYTKMDLTGFGDEVGVTWKKTISANDRGIDILEVFENGIAYIEGVVVAEELADPNTFYFNYNTRILYIHTTGGGDPADFLIEGAFWLYFSTHKDKEFAVNGRLNFYLPFLAKEDIPDITQEIKPYFEGSFLISSGSIAFMNGKIRGEHFFDKKYATYTWENSKLVLKAGRDDFSYAEFKTILTSFIDEKSCNDSRITLTLRDLRQEMERDLILTKFTLASFPDIEEDFVGEPISICFGTKYKAVAVPIDVDNEKYKFHDGRSKSVLEVRKNSTLLTVNADYFVDLQRSIITFDRDGKFVITAGVNDEIDFKEGANVRNATIDPGIYTTTELATEMKRVMEIAGGYTYTITCSGAPDRLFSILGVGGTLQLLWKTGAHGSDNTDTHVGTTIGYNDDEDDIDAVRYTADKDVITMREEDIVEIGFIGLVNSADEPIANGAEVFKYLMNNHYNLLDSELNLDSIYRAKYAKEDELSIFLYKDTPYREIVRTIEHSMEAFTFQDTTGRLGLRPQLAAAESKVKYIRNHQIFNHLQSKARSSLFWKVNVYYNENPQLQEWEVKSAQDDNIPIRYKIWNELNIDSYFSAPSSAQALAISIKNLLNKETIENTVPMLLFDVMAGDIIKFNRDRFYSTAGTIDEGSEVDLRIIRISKSPPSGQTTITTEIV